MAWLNAIPEKQTEPRTKLNKNPAMPDIEFGEYILQVLFEIGTVKNGMSGAVPIDNTDILAWQYNSGIELSAWECRQLIHLSRAYAAMSHEAKDIKCIAPYIPPRNIDHEKRKQIAEALQNTAKIK